MEELPVEIKVEIKEESADDDYTRILLGFDEEAAQFGNNHHNTEELFECGECGKRFDQSSELAVHRRIHLGGGECRHCLEQKFNRQQEDERNARGQIQVLEKHPPPKTVDIAQLITVTCKRVHMPKMTVSEFLTNLSLFNLNARVGDEENAIHLLVGFGVLPSKDTERKCYLCGAKMHWNKRDRYRMGWCYVCASEKHNKLTESPMTNTWLEGIHVSFRQVFLLLASFVRKIPIAAASLDAQVNKETAFEWYCVFAVICDMYATHYLDADPIGGPFLHVELCETHRVTRKKEEHRERYFVLSGVCLETGDRFCTLARKRDRETVWGLVKKHVSPGSALIYASTVSTDIYKDIVGEEGRKFGLDIWQSDLTERTKSQRKRHQACQNEPELFQACIVKHEYFKKRLGGKDSTLQNWVGCFMEDVKHFWKL